MPANAITLTVRGESVSIGDLFKEGGQELTHPPSAVAFGNFDGVHVGHRALFAHLREVAQEQHLRVTALTFDPHPLQLLRPELAPRALDTLAWRRHWLEQAGAAHVEVLRFDQELRLKSAEWFAEHILFRRLNAKILVVSDESRFGHQGRGDRQLLEQMAPRFGVKILRCEAVVRSGTPVSSSRIRRLVAAGEVTLANEMLERRFALRGQVIHGDGRGRTIGFPTANLAVDSQVHPASGVYAGWLVRQLPGQPDQWRQPAVCNIGVRPTVDGTRHQIEAHVIDWQGDLYGQSLSLHIEQRLRGERRFESIERLQEQIARDRDRAQVILAETP
ncbi:MAG TPA: riboflavin biosynthesis protein RibF [Myxococcales bacterium]|nr:riboflavin biosynthesis protein RibF [Myxococcales bacterium]